MAFLVSSMVTYVLIPGNFKRGILSNVFFQFTPLVLHNANVVFMAIEILINRMHFCLWHYPFILLYGLTYVVASWFFVKIFGAFFYFFLDYAHKYAIFMQLGLVLVVSLILLLTIHHHLIVYVYVKNIAFFLFGYGISLLHDTQPTVSVMASIDILIIHIVYLTYICLFVKVICAITYLSMQIRNPYPVHDK
jgi:hypothetical protein